LIEKGVIVLLDACCLLKNKNIPFKLVIVGGETNELDAKQLSLEINSRGLTQCVEYQGRKYGSEKERILRKSDMFVFPTFYHNECFPLVLLEAMANSLPCISTNEGGIPGIISQGVNGYMVEKKNAVQLAEKIETLICDKMLLQSMSRNARKSYVERFTLQGFEIRLNDILNSLTQS
jgi:glycosyltransferase involved in cell wall biosynthesis